MNNQQASSARMRLSYWKQDVTLWSSECTADRTRRIVASSFCLPTICIDLAWNKITAHNSKSHLAHPEDYLSISDRSEGAGLCILTHITGSHDKQPVVLKFLQARTTQRLYQGTWKLEQGQRHSNCDCGEWAYSQNWQSIRQNYVVSGRAAMQVIVICPANLLNHRDQKTTALAVLLHYEIRSATFTSQTWGDLRWREFEPN